MNNLESSEVDKRHQKTLRQRRPIFGNRVYLSHPETNKCVYLEPPPLFNNLKSSSLIAVETNVLDNAKFPALDEQANEVKTETRFNVTDSSTQTSKTILQLAKLETGCLTPDSLMQSPRDPDLVNRDSELNLRRVESKLQVCPTNSKAALSYSLGSVSEQSCSSLTYVRKNNLKHYLDGHEASRTIPSDEEIQAYPTKSLTETFLAKKQCDDGPSMCYCRSKFLQQTSPLRNLTKGFSTDQLKSQSCIETYDPSFVQHDTYQAQIPYQSRFIVKNIREQQFTSRTRSLKYYWSDKGCSETDFKDEGLCEQRDGDGCENIFSNECKMTTDDTKKTRQSRRGSSFMSPTIASEQRNQLHMVQNLKHLISPTRRGKSLSPNRSPQRVSNLVRKFNTEKIPYIDQSSSHVEVIKPITYEIVPRKPVRRRNELSPVAMSPLTTKPQFDEDLLKIDLQSLDIKTSEETLEESLRPSCSSSMASGDSVVCSAMNRIRSREWNVALKGLAEMTELCRIMDTDLLYPHMITVNQRLLELLRCPRSHVCRTACQAAGHFFESMKDTRKPEFDDIVENLLYKTADSNKFIRKDANLSLDCMVTHIPIFHAVRSLCLKGPHHKNPLVRTATVRLIVCAVVITGPDIILNLQSHEPTRKRIIQHMSKFLQDKDLETRKYGERLYKIFCKEPAFESCLKKYLEKEDITLMRKLLKLKNR